MEAHRVKIHCLRPFLIGPGKITRVGEVYDVTEEVCRNVVARNYARTLTDDELAALERERVPETPPIVPTTRDPKVRTR